ncbi:MAG: response regulator transcription factor [Firmicutes bacterium]|nr:response regulator transcription factor [Bacillota bacterium]
MIYLLEDDESIRKLVLYALETQGFQAAGFESSEKFWKALEQETPDLLLLDIMLPGEDGLTILQKLRAAGNQLPVIMLTAKNSEYDRVQGLDAGADDYISKPFGIMELMARIRAVLRRTDHSGEPAEFRSGDLQIFWDKHEVYVNKQAVSLTYKEYELLRHLAENQGIVLTRETLLERVWGPGADRENRTLDVHIRTLRSKLGEAGSCIQTIRGVGYKFTGDSL